MEGRREESKMNVTVQTHLKIRGVFRDKDSLCQRLRAELHLHALQEGVNSNG